MGRCIVTFELMILLFHSCSASAVRAEVGRRIVSDCASIAMSAESRVSLHDGDPRTDHQRGKFASGAQYLGQRERRAHGSMHTAAESCCENAVPSPCHRLPARGRVQPRGMGDEHSRSCAEQLEGESQGGATVPIGESLTSRHGFDVRQLVRADLN